MCPTHKCKKIIIYGTLFCAICVYAATHPMQVIKGEIQEHTDNEPRSSGKSPVTLPMVNASMGARVIVTDANGNILFVNKSMEKASGFSVVEMIGKTPGNLWGGKMNKTFYKNMWHAIKNEQRHFRGHVQNQTKDGEKYWQELQIFPVIGQNNKINFFVGIERDIINHKTLPFV